MKIQFETAKLARERGFSFKPDSPAFNYYLPNAEVLEPQYFHKYYVKFCYPICSQEYLAAWLRNTYKIHIIVSFYSDSEEYDPKYQVSVTSYINYKWSEDFMEEDFSIYEEAFERGLQEGLKLIK